MLSRQPSIVELQGMMQAPAASRSTSTSGIRELLWNGTRTTGLATRLISATISGTLAVTWRQLAQ